jgi:O-antigen/teichoic acid export membrane protein
MMQKVANIAKNTSYYTIALIFQKVISFSYFIIIARAIGPEDLGKYYFAISLTTMFAIFIDLGFANVLMREIPRDRANAQKILSTILAAKLPLAAVAVLAVSALINFLGYPETTIILVYISSISMLLDSFTLAFYSVVRGFHNLTFESAGSLVFQAIIFISGVIVLESGGGLKFLMAGLAFASLFNFIYSALVVRFRFNINPVPDFDRGSLKSLIYLAIPFSLYAIFQRGYTYLDTILLSSIAGDIEVGLYQIAFKIITALQFLPMAFSASLYPALSFYYKNNRGQLGVTFERAMNYLLIISLPISIGTIAVADKIIPVFKSGYADALWPLRISIMAAPFMFLNFPVGALLNACEKQRKNTANMGIVLASSVLLNLALVPSLGAVGASITFLLTSILMFILGIILTKELADYRADRIITVFLKALLAGVAMGVAVFFLKAKLNIFIVAGAGGLVYFLVLFASKALRKEDILSILISFRRST